MKRMMVALLVLTLMALTTGIAAAGPGPIVPSPLSTSVRTFR